MFTANAHECLHVALTFSRGEQNIVKLRCEWNLAFKYLAFMWYLGQVKKANASRARPLHFLAPPLFFHYFFMSNVFMSKNQQASLVKPIATVYTPI